MYIFYGSFDLSIMLTHCCPNKDIERPCNMLFLLKKEAFSTGHRLERHPASATILPPRAEGMVMYSGRLVFSQVMDHLPMKTFGCRSRIDLNIFV